MPSDRFWTEPYHGITHANSDGPTRQELIDHWRQKIAAYWRSDEERNRRLDAFNEHIHQRWIDLDLSGAASEEDRDWLEDKASMYVPIDSQE